MGDSIELVWGSLELKSKKEVKFLKGIGVSNTEVFKQIKKFEKKITTFYLKIKVWYYLYKTDR